MSSDGEQEILSKWPPKAVVCIIDDDLICELTGLNVHNPQYVDHLAQLTSLDLHLRDGEKGKIRRIENLTKLPLLNQLNLSYNALHKMEGLTSLRHLVELNLAENSLTRIEGIFHMQQLQRLNLCGNLIERVPSSITSLRSLSAIRLNRNRLSCLQDLEHFREMHATLRNLRVDNNLFPPSSSSSSSPELQLRHLVLIAVTPLHSNCPLSLEVLDNQTVTSAEREAAAAATAVEVQQGSHQHHQHHQSEPPAPSPPSSESSLSSSSSSSSSGHSSIDMMRTNQPHPPSDTGHTITGHTNTGHVSVHADMGLLQQRLVAEQRRAELLEEEAQQARRHFHQLTSSSSPPSSGSGRGGRPEFSTNISGRGRGSPQQQAASQRELALISRLRTEKSNEALEAKALVSQLQQELTFQQIDNTFDQWGVDTSPPPSSSSTTSDDSSTKHFQNIYSDRNIRQQQERSSYAAVGGGEATVSSRPPPPASSLGFSPLADTNAGHSPVRERDREELSTAHRSPSSSARVSSQQQQQQSGSGSSSNNALGVSGGGEGEGDLAARLQVVTSQLKQTEREKVRLQDALSGCTARMQQAEREASTSKAQVLALEREKQQDKISIQRLSQLLAVAQDNDEDNDDDDSIGDKQDRDISSRGGEEASVSVNVRGLQQEVARWRDECSERAEQVAALQRQLTAATATATAASLITASETSAGLEAEVEVKLLTRRVEELQQQLEGSQRDGSTSRDLLVQMRKENSALRQSLQESSGGGSSADSTEQMLGQLRAQVASKDTQLKQAEVEETRLREALEACRGELETALRSHIGGDGGDGSRPAYSSNYNHNHNNNAGSHAAGAAAGRVSRGAGMMFPTKGLTRGATAQAHAHMRARNHENYFDETESSIDLSTDHDQDYDQDTSLLPLSAPDDRVGFKQQSSEGKRSSSNGAGGGERGGGGGGGGDLLRAAHIHATADGLRGHETVAAHSLATAILEELQQAFAASPVPPAQVPVSQLKRACVSAALRLICSAGHAMKRRGGGGGGENKGTASAPPSIPPLEVFGEAAVIAQLVSDGQAALDELQDTKHLRLEKLQLERVLSDLNEQVKQVEQRREGKEKAISLLSKQCEETKQHAQATLSDLNVVMEKLKEGRIGVLAQDQQILLKNKEIEAANVEFEDINKLSQMEHKNIDAVRLRLRALHKDKTACEERLAGVRQKASLEESRFRNAKSVGSTEIRGLHEELVTLQSQLTARRKEVEGVRKAGEEMEAQQEQRQRETHQQHMQHLRAAEEGRRVLSGLEVEVSATRSALEALVKKKKQVGGEVAEAEEQLLAVQRQVESEAQVVKRVIRDKEKQISDLEKTFRVSKERVTELENDQAMLTLVLDDLKRLQVESEKSHESRKREMEVELEAVQGSLRTAERQHRASSLAGEQKRAEAEALLGDVRAHERRLEEARARVREQEQGAEVARDVLASLATEQEQLRKELSAGRREEEELKHRLVLAKSTLEQETRAVRALQDEESEWKDRMSRSKATYFQTKTSSEEAQSEADSMRVTSDRERRDLGEIRSKKSVVEAELARYEEELKYVQEQSREEERRRAAGVMEAARAQEEAARWQRELLDTQRRCSEARKQEDQLRRREVEAGQLKDRLRTEAENLAALVAAEQQSMESVRGEKAVLLAENKQAREEHRQQQKELNSVTSSLEASRVQMTHLDAVKEGLLSEVSRLRDSASLEISRAERVSETHKEAERRLRDLRADLSREEAALERAETRHAEEEGRCAQTRRALLLATDELTKMEASVLESNELIHSQRNQAIEEISKLGQIKQSVQNEVLTLSDSKHRQERLHSTPSLPAHWTHSPPAAPPPSFSLSSSAREKQGRLVRTQLQQSVSEERRGNVPTVYVFEDPDQVVDPAGDVSRELDETVFRSLQAAQMQQQTQHSRWSTEQQNEQQFNEQEQQGGEGGGAAGEGSSDRRMRMTHTAASSQSQSGVMGAEDNTSGGGSSSNGGSSGSGRDDVLDLRSEMQKLRDQTAAILH